MRWGILVALASTAAGGVAACSGAGRASSEQSDAGADGTAETDGGSGNDASGSDASGGDDQSALDATQDGNLDSTSDTGSVTTVDSPFGGPDGITPPPSCSVQGAACSVPAPDGGQLAQLCSCSPVMGNGGCTLLCLPCFDWTDDTRCATAYGGDGGQQPQPICLGGVCVSACRSSSQCPGDLCDPQTHACVPCTSDAQCRSDPSYGGTFICDTTGAAGAKGTCVHATCSPTGSPCSANGGDVCCGTCVPGNCCDDTMCSGATPSCQSHQCTACDAPVIKPSGGTYVVDPVDGSDAVGTGSGTAGGAPAGVCAFKTITHAVAVIGTPAAGPPLIISVAAGTASAATGESFPIVVPPNTVVQGARNGALGVNYTTVINATATDTFVLTQPGASVQAIILDGRNVATDGVVIGPTGVFTVSRVEARYFGLAGVRVRGTAQASLTDVEAHNDTEGVYVTDQAEASLSTYVPVQIHHNVNDGILVDSGGSISITGCSSCYEQQSDHNGRDGIRIVQTAASPSLNVLDPVLILGNGGAGLFVGTGSAVWMRATTVGGNAVGVHIAAAPGATNLSVAGIDLGTGHSDNGSDAQAAAARNTLQGPVSNSTYRNTGAGLCVDVPGGSGVVQAQGNGWADPAGAQYVSCDDSGGGVLSLVTGASDCSQGGGADVVVTTGTGDTVDTAVCTQN
jgi:hypothetical protein